MKMKARYNVGLKSEEGEGIGGERKEQATR